MTISHETQSGPRSYDEFVSVNDLDSSSNHWPEFSAALQGYREKTATKIGKTTDELHMMGDEAIRAALAAAEANETKPLELTA